MAKKKSSKKKNLKEEKNVEVFEVEGKDKKVKEIVKKSAPEEEHATKAELKKQQKQLKNIFLVFGFIVLIFILVFAGLRIIRISYYENVKFETVQEGELIFYNTKVPLFTEDGNYYNDYNFYLRTKPSDLKKVPFEGELSLMKGYTINITEELNCEGYGTIALANLIQQYKLLGIIYINDENASCDAESRYNYFEIKVSNETKIVQRGNSTCYDIYVKDCEIIPATEKIMAENFVMIKDLEITV